jgi:hypothetical protein
MMKVMIMELDTMWIKDIAVHYGQILSYFFAVVDYNYE